MPLVEELHGKKWPKFNSEKICHIAYGRIQVLIGVLQGLCWGRSSLSGLQMRHQHAE